MYIKCLEELGHIPLPGDVCSDPVFSFVKWKDIPVDFFPPLHWLKKMR